MVNIEYSSVGNLDSDESFEEWHIMVVYDEDGNAIDWEYIYDENGERIPLSECICAAREPSECGCSCNSWEPDNLDFENGFNDYTGD